MKRRQPRVLDQASAAEMPLEKRERQRQRPVRLRLRVGLAAMAREGMIGTGIFPTISLKILNFSENRPMVLRLDPRSHRDRASCQRQILARAALARCVGNDLQ